MAARRSRTAAFVVQNGRFTQVGTKGALRRPAGARRVDLTGKTVMPALVDAHVHLGYRNGATFTAENYTRDNLLDELDRFSYYGVAAVLEAGTGRGVLPFQVRQQAHPGARLSHRRPRLCDAERRTGRADARRGVRRHDRGRGARETCGSSPPGIRTSSRSGSTIANGTVEKLKPNLYRAIIDEAHTHGIRVMAHIAALEDAKDLLRAGIDGFGHVVRDKDIDEELIAMLRERPNVFFVETLWGERNAIYGRKPCVARRAAPPRTRCPERRSRSWPMVSRRQDPPTARSDLLRNVAALNRAGVRLGLGTDTGGVTGGGYFGLASLVELELLVKAGLTASQAIVAATRTSAAILGLDALGTIAAGKSAAFIVLDANPLDDIANTRKIAAVYLDGAEVDRSALLAKWSTIRSSSGQ